MKIGKNQYLLCPQGSKIMPSYASKLNMSHYDLFLGEDCECTVVEYKGKELSLIGYAINADKPEQPQKTMCFELLSSINDDYSNIGDLTFFWGGRYVLVVSDGRSLVAMTDACGMKSAFYQDDILASQARYIAEYLGVKDDSAAIDYISKSMKRDKEYTWPLDRTKYKSVKRLLPNHIYKNGRIERFSVRNRYVEYSDDNRANEAARLLQNSVKAAAKLKPLAITLTAGWDSRIVMAAALPDIKQYDFVTLQYSHIYDSHQDIQVPKSLCAEYGANHHLLKSRKLNANFVNEYMNHSENGHKYWIQMIQSIRDYGYENHFWTKGSCNEISRNSSGILYNWQVNARILSKLYGIFADSFSKCAIKEWLPGAKQYAKDSGYSVLELFYWEHRLGSWLAECLNEADVVGDTFSPFNVRAYFEVIKGIEVKKRISPFYTFFQNMLTVCSMNTDIPINPNRYDSAIAKINCLVKNKLHLVYNILLLLK